MLTPFAGLRLIASTIIYLVANVDRSNAFPAIKRKQTIVELGGTPGPRVVELITIWTLRSFYGPLLSKPRIRKPMILYPGESFQSRKIRTYGYGWTASKRVGRAFVETRAKTLSSGTVLLRTIAPPDAILFSKLCNLGSEGPRMRQS